MAAIIVGTQSGLTSSSLATLNQSKAGAETGRSGESVYVNAATGNLVIQKQDELLAGNGPDIEVLRTYNSQGLSDGDNNDNWRIGFYRQVKNLQGNLKTAGSKVVRVDEDGAERIYTYNSSGNNYINRDGAGSYDTLSYSSQTSRWTWTDGDSLLSETYGWTAGSGSLLSQTDLDGRSTTYTYDTGGLLTRVSDASYENVYLDYSGNKLTQVRTEKLLPSDAMVPSTRVRYTYDANDRLHTVTVDLTPDDNTIADNDTYTTTYTYFGTSKRIATLTQPDGTALSFTYDASDRITRITDGTGNRTDYSYDTSSRTTTVTDASGLQTRYLYDKSGQLLKTLSAAVNGSSIAETYLYNSNGDVTSFTNGEGNSVTYRYDASGNQTLQRDAAGNTVERIYNSNNQLLEETRYLVADPDGDGVKLPSGALTTHFVYDAAGKNQLRFSISPEGRVTEYSYNGYGQKTSEIIYAGKAYTDTVYSETDLVNWAASATHRTRSQRTDYSYDFRGQVASSKTYTRVDSNGTGVATDASTTNYIYSAAGQLLQTIAPIGGAMQTTNYSYDGLGRMLTSSNGLGEITRYQYADAVNVEVTSTTTTLPNGLRIVSSYDRIGRLVSVSQNTSSNANLATTTYYYDSTNRLRMTQDPTGLRNWIFYDAVNRRSAEIDANGTLTEYFYNKNDQVTQTAQYATAVNPAAIVFGMTDAGITGISVSSTLSSLRPSANAADRKAWNIYDASGQLIKTVDAGGAVTETRYDAAGRVRRTTEYANPISVGPLGAAPASGSIVPVADSNNDRVTHYVYDKDGLLQGEIDAEGFLTETVYDTASRPWQTIQYAGKVSSDARAAITNTSELASLRPASQAEDIKRVRLYDGQGNVTADIDAKNYLTEYRYDKNGNLTTTARYSTPLESSVIGSLKSQSDVAAIRPATTDDDQVTTTTYDHLNRINTSRNAENTVTRYGYDSVGNLTSKTVALGTTEERATNFGYDLQGRQTSIRDAAGNISTADYDSAGRLVKSMDAQSFKTFFYYDADGRLLYTINAMGDIVGSSYDVFGQKTADTKFSSPLNSDALAGLTGGVASASMITTINALGNVLLDSKTLYSYHLNGTLRSKNDAMGNVTLYQYNAFGETSSITLAATSANSVSNTYGYDKRGLQLRVTEDDGGLNYTSRQEFDAFGRMERTIDVNGTIHEYYYDKLGRQIELIDALGNNTTTTYDAFDRVLTQTDANGVETTSTYDAASRTVTVSTAGIHVSTAYNRHGQVQTVEDANGNLTTYAYDAFGNLESVVSPLSRTTQEFNARNQLAETIDANDTVTIYEYDAANRVFSKTVDPGGLNLVTLYGYDAKGQQVTVTRPEVGVTRYDYDLNGQLVSQTQDYGVGKLNIVTGYDYDALGRRFTVTDVSDGLTRYVYDKLDRLTYLVDVLGGLTRYEYDADNNLVRETRYATPISANENPSDALADGLANAAENQTVRHYYDAANRKTYTVDSSGALTAFEYDNNGNVTRQTSYANILSDGQDPSQVEVDSARDQATRNVYNENNRLVYTADGNGAVTGYEYDGNGKVIMETRFADPMAVDAIDPSSVASDSVRDQVSRYAYDAAGRLSFMVDAVEAVTSYHYDGNGNITKQTAYANPLMSGKAMRVESLPTGSEPVGRGSWLTGFNANDTVTMSAYFKGDSTLVSGRIQIDAYSQQGAYVRSYTMASVYGNDSWQKLTLTANLDQNYSLAIWIMGDQGDYKPAGQAGYYDNIVVSSVGKGVVLREQFESAPWSGGTLADQAAAPLSHSALGSLVLVDAARDQVLWKAYDANNRLAYAIDGNGAVTGYDYDVDGNVIRLTRYASDIAEAIRNAWGDEPPSAATIAAQLDSGNGRNRSIITDYDALGRVTQVTQPAVDAYDGTAFFTTSPVSRYVYNALGQVIQTQVKKDNTTWLDTFHYYDARGLENATVDALGYLTTQVYDAFGNLTERTEYRNAASNFTSGGYTAPAANNDDRKVHYTYDKNNRKRTETRENVEYTLAIDAAGLGSVATTRGDLTSHYDYDAFGNLTQMTDAMDTTVHTYFDQANRIKAVTDPTRPISGNDNFTGITEFIRDTFGNVVLQKERARGATALDTYGYTVANDANDRVNSFSFDRFQRLTQSMDAVGASQEMAYDSLGNLASQTSRARDADAVVQTIVKHFAYDHAGRLTSTTEPASASGQSVTTQMRYNAFGELTDRGIVGVEDDWSEYFHLDDNGRVWRTNSGDGVNKVLLHDLQGKLTAEIRSATVDLKSQASAASVHALSDTRRTDNTWDELGRLSLEKRAERDVDGNDQRPQVTRTYDRWGNLLTVNDPANSSWVTDYLYNNNNQVIWERKPSATLQATDLASYVEQRPVTSYYYDYAGNQLAVRDARNHVNGRSYDSAGNVLQEFNADGGVINRQYDAFGNETRRTDANGNVTSYRYNRLGQITEIIRPQADFYTVNERVFDSAVSVTGYHGWNQTEAIQKYQVGTYQYTEGTPEYDVLRYTRSLGIQSGYRAIVDSDTTPAGAQTLISSANIWGDGITGIANRVAYLRVESLDTSDPVIKSLNRGTSILLGYDQRGLKSSVRDGSGQTISYRYDLRGNVRQTVMPGGATTTFGYDYLNRKTTETDALGNTQTWTYDYFGRLIGRHDLANASHQYNYDKAGQLTAETDSRGLRVETTYDNAGQVTQIMDFPLNTGTGNLRRTTQYRYDAAGRRTVESTNFDSWMSGYDGEGDVPMSAVLRDQHHLAYNSLGHLTSVTAGNQTLLYKYDLAGNRSYQSENFGGNLSESYAQFDAMNRQTLFGGIDAYGLLTEARGMRVQYDLNGNRSREMKGSGGWDQTQYEYDALNRLAAQVDVTYNYWNSAPYTETGRRNFRHDRADRSVAVDLEVKDADGNRKRQVSQYDAAGRLVQQAVILGSGYGYGAESVVMSDYDVLGNVLASSSYGTGYENDTSYQYERGQDGYKQGTITTTQFYRDTGQWNTGDGQVHSTGVSTFYYETNGALARVYDAESDTPVKNRTMYNDAAGNALKKVENSFGIFQQLGESFALNNLVANGRVLGTYGQTMEKDGSLLTVRDFLAADSIRTSVTAGSQSIYRIKTGDSLQGIALAVYGDAQMWYLIADANGMREGTPLRAGETLVLPKRPGTVHNNSDTFKPFDSASFIGDTSPTVPRLAATTQVDQCAMVGIIIAAVVVSVVITVVTAGIGTAILSAAGGAIFGLSAATSAILVGATAGAVGGTLASMASQGIMIAGKLQKEMNWNDVALGALSGFVGGASTAALGALATSATKAVQSGVAVSKSTKYFALMMGATEKLSSLSIIPKTKVAAAMIGRTFFYGATDAATAAVTQKLGMDMGLQKQFDWSQVALSAIQVTGSGGSMRTPRSIMADAERAAARSMVRAARLTQKSNVSKAENAIALNLIAGDLKTAYKRIDMNNLASKKFLVKAMAQFSRSDNSIPGALVARSATGFVGGFANGLVYGSVRQLYAQQTGVQQGKFDTDAVMRFALGRAIASAAAGGIKGAAAAHLKTSDRMDNRNFDAFNTLATAGANIGAAYLTYSPGSEMFNRSIADAVGQAAREGIRTNSYTGRSAMRSRPAASEVELTKPVRAASNLSLSSMTDVNASARAALDQRVQTRLETDVRDARVGELSQSLQRQFNSHSLEIARERPAHAQDFLR